MPQMPALLMSVILASTCAAAFHLWQGRSVSDLLVFWLAAVLGFAAGQLAGQQLNLVPWTIGQVQVVEGSLGALLFLVVVRWLRRDRRMP